MGWTGTRPRTNIGMLERLGVDVVINGTFDADSDWNKGTGWDINTTTAGKAYCDGSQVANSAISQALAGITGKKFRGQYTISGLAAGALRQRIGASTNGDYQVADGTYSEDLIASGAEGLYLIGNTDFIGNVDDFSVKQISLS